MKQDIAECLRRLREARGWSQYELGRRAAGVDRGYIGQLEARRIVKPVRDKLLALAKALDVNPGTLLEAAGYPPIVAGSGEGENVVKKVDWDVIQGLARLSYNR